MRMVSVRNKTSSRVEFGEYSISPNGTVYMPYAKYSDVIKNYPVQAWGLDVNIRDVSFKIVSVKDFGARGDGVSNDTYQIQSAIDYVADNGGGVVNIPVGVYPVRTLMVKGNVVLAGESRTDSVLRSTSINGDPVLSFVGGECGARTLRLVY